MVDLVIMNLRVNEKILVFKGGLVIQRKEE